MKLINVTLNTPPLSGQNYTYKLKVTDNYGNSQYVHYGKFYVAAGQGTVTLDLEDVLFNYRFRGSQSIKPVLNVATSSYDMPVSSAAVVTDFYYNYVEVVDTELTPRFSSTPKQFWFVPVDTYGYEFSVPAGLAIAPVGALTPHIPMNAPAGFNFSVLLYNNSNATVNVVYKRDTTVVGTFTVAPYKPYYRPLSGATEGYYINDILVAKVDQCTKPYYLLWLGCNGGLQCQGFTQTSELSVKYNQSQRMDMHNGTWANSKSEVANWKLKSVNLNDEEYEAYGEMFSSPYLVLVDTVHNRLHYVNVKSTDYKEKKRTVTNRKPFWFEIDLESCQTVRC